MAPCLLIASCFICAAMDLSVGSKNKTRLRGLVEKTMLNRGNCPIRRLFSPKQHSLAEGLAAHPLPSTATVRGWEGAWGSPQLVTFLTAPITLHRGQRLLGNYIKKEKNGVLLRETLLQQNPAPGSWATSRGAAPVLPRALGSPLSDMGQLHPVSSPFLPSLSPKSPDLLNPFILTTLFGGC